MDTFDLLSIKEPLPLIIWRRALAEPDRLCAAGPSGSCTWGELCVRAVRAALTLCGQFSAGEGDCVAVECTQDARYLILDLACNLLGAVFVPTEAGAAAQRARMILEETQAKLYIRRTAGDAPCLAGTPEISMEAFAERCAETSVPEQLLSPAAGAAGADGETPDLPFLPQPLRFPALEETAEILYTTGTTGKSKGIEITHANNLALAQNICGGTGMREHNVEFVPLPLSHSHGLRCCYANLLAGGTLLLTDGVANVRAVYAMLKEYGATAMDLSPTAASVLLRLSKGRFAEFDDTLDYIQIGTAAMTEELKDALRAAFPSVRLYNFYGSTESGRSCALNFNSSDDRPHCVGRPTPNAHFIVTDDARRPLASSGPDHTGLLACGGPMNMKGYYKQPELTAQTMSGGYVYTNDEGYIDEEGFVYVLGRRDDVINYKGIKIAPDEIEAAAMRFPGVRDCACVPMPDPVAGQVPKLFVAAADPDSFDRKALMRFLQEHLEPERMPAKCELIGEIPRTFNGKIQRKKLLENK